MCVRVYGISTPTVINFSLVIKLRCGSFFYGTADHLSVGSLLFTLAVLGDMKMYLMRFPRFALIYANQIARWR